LKKHPGAKTNIDQKGVRQGKITSICWGRTFFRARRGRGRGGQERSPQKARGGGDNERKKGKTKIGKKKRVGDGSRGKRRREVGQEKTQARTKGPKCLEDSQVKKRKRKKAGTVVLVDRNPMATKKEAVKKKVWEKNRGGKITHAQGQSNGGEGRKEMGLEYLYPEKNA